MGIELSSNIARDISNEHRLGKGGSLIGLGVEI
jgi:hypothetical protein